jgi:hypothetical protein
LRVRFVAAVRDGLAAGQDFCAAAGKRLASLLAYQACPLDRAGQPDAGVAGRRTGISGGLAV